MCHCKTCADRLHVIIVTNAIAIPYSLASCLIRIPFLHTCIPFTLRLFYALPVVHDTSSKNAKLSSATTSFPWRHTNTSKNHGYNALADDSRRQPFRAEDSALVPDKEGQKGRKGRTLSDHTYPTACSRPKGRCVQSLVQIGSEMWICIRYKLTKNKLSALCVRQLKIKVVWGEARRLECSWEKLWEPQTSWRLTATEVKGKAIPLQARTGTKGSRSLRLPHFKTIGTWRW